MRLTGMMVAVTVAMTMITVITVGKTTATDHLVTIRRSERSWSTRRVTIVPKVPSLVLLTLVLLLLLVQWWW